MPFFNSNHPHAHTGALCNVLSKLMGGPARFAELQAVLERLQYGKDKDEVSFSQLSEGLAMLGG